MDTLTTATLNINGLGTATRIAMLESFIRVNEIDLLMLQEVTTTLPLMLHHLVHHNIGANRRGTAIIVRDTLNITNLTQLPSGPAMAVDVGATRIINIYAPSGTAKRQERETFYNSDLPGILRKHAVDILGGDFNCVLDKNDATGQGTYSRSIATLIKGYSLQDAWQPRPGRKVYTHYTRHGGARLDRFYLTNNQLARKKSIETIATAFTDHLAVVLRLIMEENLIRWERGAWKLNCKVLTPNRVMEVTGDHWREWKHRQPAYPNINLWWVRLCKMKLRQTFRQEEAERRKEFRHMENFYYECTYDIVNDTAFNNGSIAALNHLKAKIVKLNAQRLHMTMSDTESSHLLSGEPPTLYQQIPQHKRKDNRLVRSVRDGEANIQTSPPGIAKTFTRFFQEKYAKISVDLECTNVGNTHPN
jgi:exonuclease III